MSRVKNEALNLVKDGNWVFDLLQPVFVSELELHTNKSGLKLSLTQLTLAAYLQISQIKSTQFPEIITMNSFENEKMFQLIAEKVYSGGMASNFTELEIQTINKTSLMFLNLSPELFRLTQYVFTGLFRINNNNFSGASYPHAYGIYFTGDNFFKITLEERCLSFVHELAHQELFLLNLIDRLVEKEADFNLNYAPYQEKPRPPIGRLHSLAAIFRMLQFSSIFSGNQELLKRKFNETRISLKKGELTVFGEMLILSMENYLKDSSL